MERSQRQSLLARCRATAVLRLSLSLALFGITALYLSAAVWTPSAAAQGSVPLLAGAPRATTQPLWVLGSDGNDLIRIHQAADGSLTITVNGSDTVVAAADVPRLIIDGFEGNDQIIADPSVTAPLTILDGPGNDTIVGGGGNNYIDAVEGNCYIYGGAGGDNVIYAGPGNSTIIGGPGDNYIDAGPGDDSLSGGNGNDVLIAGQGHDVLNGGGGDNVLIGGPGSDSFVSGPGNNTVFAEPSDAQPIAAPGSIVWQDPVPLWPLAGSVIVEDGDYAFGLRLDADLQALLSLPSGRRLLEELDAAGKRVVIDQSAGGNETTILDPPAALLRPNGDPGSGSACIIDYNTMQTTIEDGSQPWMHRPPIVGLYHELIHALNAATGTLQPGQTDGVPNSELQDIGLPCDGIAWHDHWGLANPGGDGNPTMFTENGLRALLGLPRRTRF